MYAAKCLTIFVVLFGLAIMWILARKKTNQIMIAIAAYIAIAGMWRLYRLMIGGQNEQSMYVIVAALAGMVVIWLLSWLSNRAAMKRRRPTDSERAVKPSGRNRGD
jgi:membrane associated rhomboid family serine protease